MLDDGYEYEIISLDEALKLMDKDIKVYIQSPYCSNWYNELDTDYNPNITWGEIAHILRCTTLYKRVKVKGNE